MYRTIFFLFIITSQFSFSQSLSEDWNKVVILDKKGNQGYGSFDRRYEINRVEAVLREMKIDTVTIIKAIDTDVIPEILKLTEKEAPRSKDPFEIYGADTNWFKANVDSLWFDLKEKSEIDERQILEEEDEEVVLSILNDYSIYRDDLDELESLHDWREVNLSMVIMSETDTVVISNGGSFVYLLPWVVSGKEIYNTELSILIAQLLPGNRYFSNYQSLRESEFYPRLLTTIYDYYIYGETDFRKAKRRFPLKFKRLENKFEIKGGSYSIMGSIEWANDFFLALPCVEVELHENRLPKNINYTPLFGCRLYFMHPIGPFLRKRKRIVERLEKNPVYQYIAAQESCYGSIHFVNRRSFSPIAKKSFKEDLRDNNIDVKNYRGRLRKAIFFDNYEHIDGESSFTRWLFLNDGTTILWQNKGANLLNVKPEHIPPDGYNCKEIGLEHLEGLE